MQIMNSPSLQEEELRSIIARFIQQLYEVGGSAIRHVTVTLHGQLEHFSTSRHINAIAVRKTDGVTTLCYQDLDVETPIATTVTLVATKDQRTA